jgi:DNA-binding CsgD family transcriptional regulator/GAF domain-containing protein
MPAARHAPRHGSDLAKGTELVRFTESLLAASSLEDLRQRYLAGFGRLLDVRINGFDLVDPETTRQTYSASVNVSDAFLASYRRNGWRVDPLRSAAYATGRPAYNGDLMSAEEWLESEVYRRALRLHSMRHLVEVPMRSAGRLVGHLNFARSDPAHEFSPDEIRLAEAVAQVVGVAIERLDASEQMTRQRDQALAALELTGTAIVISDPGEPELRLNDAARRLFGEIVDAEERLHELLARPLAGAGFSRRVAVELASGEAGVVHAHANPVPHHEGGLVAVLELVRDQPAIAPGALAVLTQREREVASLVVDGLSDREIAERLHLSRYTVSQHVTQIYRKLHVGSRVGLTRLLLRRR